MSELEKEESRLWEMKSREREGKRPELKRKS